jgi:hypothetical protein
LFTEWGKKEEWELPIYFFAMEETKTRYCKECGKELKALNLTAYSKYLCPGCEPEHECFTGEGP